MQPHNYCSHSLVVFQRWKTVCHAQFSEEKIDGHWCCVYLSSVWYLLIKNSFKHWAILYLLMKLPGSETSVWVLGSFIPNTQPPFLTEVSHYLFFLDEVCKASIAELTSRCHKNLLSGRYLSQSLEDCNFLCPVISRLLPLSPPLCNSQV